MGLSFFSNGLLASPSASPSGGEANGEQSGPSLWQFPSAHLILDRVPNKLLGNRQNAPIPRPLSPQAGKGEQRPSPLAGRDHRVGFR